MVEWPHMFRNVWSISSCFDISDIYVLSYQFQSNGRVRIRKTLEAWNTSATKRADNNSKPIQDQYNIRFKSSYLINTFFLCLKTSYIYVAFFAYILSFLHFIFYPSKAVDRQPKAYVLLMLVFLARERVFFLIWIMSHPGCASIFCLHSTSLLHIYLKKSCYFKASFDDPLEKRACSHVFDCLRESVCSYLKTTLNEYDHSTANAKNKWRSAKFPRVILLAEVSNSLTLNSIICKLFF